LGNKLDVNFKKGECLHRLDMEEKHEINLDVKLKNNGVTAECQEHISQEFQKRYDSIKAQIEQFYLEGKKDEAEQKGKLESTKEEMDEDEGVFE
jgi:hypothetical protein